MINQLLTRVDERLIEGMIVPHLTRQAIPPRRNHIHRIEVITVIFGSQRTSRTHDTNHLIHTLCPFSRLISLPHEAAGRSAHHAKHQETPTSKTPCNTLRRPIGKMSREQQVMTQPLKLEPV